VLNLSDDDDDDDDDEGLLACYRWSVHKLVSCTQTVVVALLSPSHLTPPSETERLLYVIYDAFIEMLQPKRLD